MSIAKLEVLFAQGRYEMAYKELKSILSSQPDNSEFLNMLAICCLNLRKFDEGKTIIQDLIYREPWNPHFKYLLANLMAQTNELQPALKMVTEAISQDSYNANYFDLKSRIHLALSQNELAEESSRQSLEIDPQNQDALNSLSKALIAQNRGEEAAKVMDKALEYSPENWETHANYGYRSLEQGKVPEAIEHFRNALLNDPNKTFAQQGMKLAVKAKFPLYKWLLQFGMYMSKKGQSFNLIFIFGLIFLLNTLNRLKDSLSGVAQYGIIALIAVLFLFVMSTWILDPIMTFVLYTNKNGRLSLTEKETNTAKFVGISLLIAVCGAALTLLLGDIIWLNVAGIGIVGLLCSSGMWERDTSKARLIATGFYAVSSLFFVLGLSSKMLVGTDDMYTSIAVLTAVVYTWAGNSIFSRS